MAIIVGGKPFDPKTDKVQKPKPSAQKLGDDSIAKWQKQNIQIDKYTFDKNKTYLVIDGEVHELRKKSAFLLDMITK